MEVILADVLGYCMGVRRAMESAIKALDCNCEKKVYSLGPLIHNQTALNLLSKKGLTILDESSAQEAENSGIVIIRAHGVPPSVNQILEKKGCKIINATCPRVVSSQKNAAKFASKNCTIILVGDKNHGEVAGIAGYAGDKFILLENYLDAQNLEFSDINEKALLISQTTFSPTEFEKIAELLTSKYKNISVMNTICPATKERQEALLKLCPMVDGILVVGGKNSANTKRLLLTAQKHCRIAALIENADEIPKEFFLLDKVGVTAGASTPDSVIMEVRQRLINKNNIE